MFTGLVEETGNVEKIFDAGEGKRIELSAEKVFEDAEIGDSINVSGACLTVEEFTEEGVKIFLAEETLDRTWFSDIEEGDEVNLERSLTPSDRMGGHYVQGHVDAVSEIEDIERAGDADCSCGESACRSNSEKCSEGWNFSFKISERIEEYIVEKGFIAIEGISLTITEVEEESFSVTIIPETWKKTNFSELEEGDEVNFEADVMAKYAEKISRYN